MLRSAAFSSILCRFAEKYFANELKAGTPFTFDGAKELMRLGILAIVIPLSAKALAAIVYAVLKLLLEGVEAPKDWYGISVGLGMMMIVTAVICRYGAELKEGAAPEEPTL